MTDHIHPTEVRCSNVACNEIVDRLKAADLIEYVDGCREHAARLRATAARIAAIHREEAKLREAS